MSGLNLLQGTLFSNNLKFCNGNSSPLIAVQHKSCFNNENVSVQRKRRNHLPSQGNSNVLHNAATYSLPYKEKNCSDVILEAFPHVQTLRHFPKKQLCGKVVMVRLDSAILLHEEIDHKSPSIKNSLSTIKYLHDAGAKVVLASNWRMEKYLGLPTEDCFAEILSALLQLKVAPVEFVTGRMQSKLEDDENSDVFLFENLSQFKEEHSNCSKFAELLSEGIDVFVNDAFSQSHRILASTVGITRFCYACLAGFNFEEDMYRLKEIISTKKRPYIAIIGGGKLMEKEAALHFLACKCDALVFVGMMAFQIMHSEGLPVPTELIEHGASDEALKIVQLAKVRRIPVLVPEDFWCLNNSISSQFKLFPGHRIMDGWKPADIGPKSIENICSLLSESEKILWIGPVNFGLASHDVTGVSKLAKMFDKVNRRKCSVTFVGNIHREALAWMSSSFRNFEMVSSASVMWEILKGRKLPGLVALDRAYPFEIEWSTTYAVVARPLVVDIGSGNGLFLFNMARRRKDLNFLGLEMNEKLVTRCLNSVHQSDMENIYFIATDATSTFRPIVSSYPGKLDLVSIQCPNPDFNRPDYRRRLLQRSLVEAIVDLLASDGKVFLQSDIEAVAVRMREQFVQYGKGKLAVMQDTNTGDEGWLKDNPFEVCSDWERHVLDRGAPMYRLLLSKSTDAASD